MPKIMIDDNKLHKVMDIYCKRCKVFGKL